MDNGYVSPIAHNTGSAVGSTAAGAASGALGGGAKGWLVGIFGPVAVGAALFGGTALLLTLTGGFSVAAGVVLGATVAGAALGGVVSYFAAIPSAIIGALFGGSKGAARASDQVTMERGAAMQMQAQVEAFKYQTMAQANSGRQYLVEPGSRFNPASANIQLGSANFQNEGRLAGAELAAAR